jgi:hypothetical protein
LGRAWEEPKAAFNNSQLNLVLDSSFTLRISEKKGENQTICVICMHSAFLTGFSPRKQALSLSHVICIQTEESCSAGAKIGRTILRIASLSSFFLKI